MDDEEDEGGRFSTTNLRRRICNRDPSLTLSRRLLSHCIETVWIDYFENARRRRLRVHATSYNSSFGLCPFIRMPVGLRCDWCCFIVTHIDTTIIQLGWETLCQANAMRRPRWPKTVQGMYSSMSNLYPGCSEVWRRQRAEQVGSHDRRTLQSCWYSSRKFKVSARLMRQVLITRYALR